jgi:pimeloyl-ACP methyl ester carboxylesterase
MAHAFLSLPLITGLASVLLGAAPRSAATADPPPYVANPERSGYVEAAGTRLYYEIHGAGQPLLLLHGGLGSSDHFAASVPHFAKRYRVILVDRRGHGRSPDTSEPFSYSAMAKETKAFLDAIGVSAARIVGWSDGGIVGFHLAASYPGVVTRLVAVGANIRVDGMSSQNIKWIENRMTEAGLAEDLPRLKESYAKLSPNPGHFADFVRKSRELWLRDPYISAAEFDGIGVPTLLITGDRNDIRLEHTVEMRSRLKGAQLCILPNVGHHLMQQKNALFNTIVTEFLEGR